MRICMGLEQKLLDRLKQLSKERKLSELADKAGIDQSNLSRALGKTKQKLGLDKVSAILEAMGAEILFPEERTSETTRDICFVDAKIVPAGEDIPPPEIEDYLAAPLVGEAGAGPGMIDQDEVLSWVLVHSSSLAVRNKSNLIAVQVGKNQRSMVPTLHPQDIVLVNRDDKGDYLGFKPPGNIFLVREPGQDGGGMIKRVSLTQTKEFATITFYSDNPEYEPETYALNEYDNDLTNAIVGRVIWAWTDLSRK